ncbi:hypothetical protein MATL_G00208110 [Megalops atlanticus]|uniref:Uncharacterized protein n=1 Tax=Megalops atlanticus TaxID=7932 RepID=A0A9D3PKV5_MEGAT|nr:hypothetical protein MATL_G00208110 [Megalops atlanticus]
MEVPEPTKTESDQFRPSKRRISSILKAPRTPLKSIGSDNEDAQEETTKPIEKKRNSRRVSFATTNDIHVFIKDFKNGCAAENLLQDLSATGEEVLDEKVVCATRDGGQQIIGMETLLNAPLHVSQQQNKENVFNYDEQNDFCDKTMVFSGDDMDMTHSHTIIIDNAVDGINGVVAGYGNLDFTPSERRDKTADVCFWQHCRKPQIANLGDSIHRGFVARSKGRCQRFLRQAPCTQIRG